MFQGKELVDWLIEYGLANTRMDAVVYGNYLLLGRVIQHCVEEHYFYDLPYFYQFCPESHPSIGSEELLKKFPASSSRSLIGSK